MKSKPNQRYEGGHAKWNQPVLIRNRVLSYTLNSDYIFYAM